MRQCFTGLVSGAAFSRLKKLRNLTPDATQSLSFAFDADLHCKGDFSVEIERWRLKAGDHPVHQNRCLINLFDV
jgi:hypothetical protein